MSKFFNKSVVRALAITFLIIGSFAMQAMEASGEAKKESKGDGKALYKRAVGKVEKGLYVSAIEDLKKLLKLNEKNADFWSLYGYAARKAGSFDVSEQAYNRALSLQPQHLGALEYSGELYLETSRLALAQERLQSLIKLCPQGCKERTLLEQAIAGKDNDGSHKISEPNW